MFYALCLFVLSNCIVFSLTTDVEKLNNFSWHFIDILVNVLSRLVIQITIQHIFSVIVQIYFQVYYFICNILFNTTKMCIKVFFKELNAIQKFKWTQKSCESKAMDNCSLKHILLWQRKIHSHNTVHQLSGYWFQIQILVIHLTALSKAT